MGFFTNSGALKEGEIVLSSDRHHLYQVVEGKLTEYEKILTPPGNPNLWIPGQKRGSSIYDMSKGVIYVYNIDAGIWSVHDTSRLCTSHMNGDLNSLAFSELSKLFESVNDLPKNTL